VTGAGPPAETRARLSGFAPVCPPQPPAGQPSRLAERHGHAVARGASGRPREAAAGECGAGGAARASVTFPGIRLTESPDASNVAGPELPLGRQRWPSHDVGTSWRCRRNGSSGPATPLAGRFGAGFVPLSGAAGRHEWASTATPDLQRWLRLAGSLTAVAAQRSVW